MPFFAWLMFRLTSHWKQFRISGSSRIGNDLPVQAHPALDNSPPCTASPSVRLLDNGTSGSEIRIRRAAGIALNAGGRAVRPYCNGHRNRLLDRGRTADPPGSPPHSVRYTGRATCTYVRVTDQARTGRRRSVPTTTSHILSLVIITTSVKEAKRRGLVSIRNLLRRFGLGDRESEDQLRAITRRRQELSGLTDDQLKSAARGMRRDAEVIETFALAAAIAERVLGLHMFDVQILVALSFGGDQIPETHPAERKTLAAVPAAI